MNRWLVGFVAAGLLLMAGIGILLIAADNEAYRCEHIAHCENGEPELWTIQRNVDGSYQAAKQAPSHSYVSDERWVAIWTFWLFAATLLLFGATFSLWLATRDALRDARNTSDRQAKEFREQLNVAKMSADAARLGAEAQMNAERPYLHVDEMKLRFETEPGEDGCVQTYIRFAFANYGRTECRLRALSLGIEWGGIPVVPRYQPPTSRRFVVVSQHQYKSLKDLEATRVKADRAQRVRGGQEQAFIVGYVTYRDNFRRTWTTPFAFVWIFENGGEESVRFYPVDIDAYWDETCVQDPA